MTNPTLEKVARAICCPTGCQAERANEADREAGRHYMFQRPCSALWSREKAIAALQSLRQVDDETVEAMRLCTIRNSRPADPTKPFESPFTAAIDHILGQEP